ncbi:MAG: type II toxin-antitoxin system RelE/ParE family toxin, partial [Thermodesulfobacteriota bacterium]
MKKVYDVRWSETSERDLTDITEYIAGDSPSYAYQVFKGIKRKVSSLYTFPDRGCIVPELQNQGITQYRELV